MASRDSQMVAGRVQIQCSRPAYGVRAASRCIARYTVARRCADHLVHPLAESAR